MLLKDTNGNKSITMTAFVIGFIVVNAKLILSGMTLWGVVLAPFTGVEYGASLAALGGIYILRRKGDNTKNDNSSS